MSQTRFIQDPAIDELRRRISGHPLYEALTDIDRIRTFMEHHVFAVWDFMSIVKSLQRELTGIIVPWTPPVDTEAARLINEIVLGEESDERPDGTFASHFELYLEAMEEAGANTETIKRFVEAIRSGWSVSDVFKQVDPPLPVHNFVLDTFKVLEGTGLHIRAAALFYGREDLIPEMFTPMVKQMETSGQPCGKFVYYLERHIEVDSGDHSVWAEGLLARLCGDDKTRKEQARKTALEVLQSRLALWDGILNAVKSKTPTTL